MKSIKDDGMKLTVKRLLYTLVIILLAWAFAFSKEAGSIKPITLSNHVKQEVTVSRDSVVKYAETLLGTPYVYGSCSKDGFDCSGFVYYVFKHFNINVPRSSSLYEDFGEEVPIEQVKKGDILVFLSPTRNAIGHLGIVVEAKGKASEFIHATSGKAMSVVTTPLTNKGYTKRFVKAVRVLP